MKREYLFLLLFALLGFTGGATTQVWLNASGSLAAPSYSFANDTDFGLYRKAATQICAANGNDADSLLCFDDGSILVSSDGTADGYVAFDTAGATFTGWKYRDSTSDYAGWVAESSSLDYFIGTYGSRAALAPAAGTLAITYMVTFSASSGNLVWGDANGGSFSGVKLGYTGDSMKFDIGDKLYVDDTTNYLTQNATDSLAWYVNNTLMGYSRNKDLFEVNTGMYLKVQSVNGGLVSTTCDATGEQGFVAHDYSTNRLYVCNFDSGMGWEYVDLAE